MPVVNLPGAAERQANHAARDTRYQPPHLFETPVPRPGIARCLQGIRGKVVILAGPPGCGKTTVLSMRHAELAARGERVGWLTLSREDNDPDRLRRRLARAFGPGLPVSDDNIAHAPEHLFGFLDGLDCLTDPAAHDVVDRFILGVPPSSVVYVTAKRLRGARLHDGLLRGMVHVIGPEQMRLDNAEASALLGEHWTRADAGRLNQFVDGWAAGLRFLARAPEASARILRTVDEQTVPPVEMADYFDDVICAAMEPQLLSILMELSVIDRFPPEIVAAMPGVACDWALLEDQIRSGTFLRHLDDARHWVAFHPAFGRHLRHRLRRCRPERYEELKRFAAFWFERNGFPAEAIRHAVSLAETPVAARIIENVGAIAVDLDDGPDVELGEVIPPERAGELPLLFMAQIYHLIRRGKHREARTFFDEACRLTKDFTQLHEGADLAVVRGWANTILMVFQTADDVPISDNQIAMLEADLKVHLGTQPVVAASIASVLAFIYLDRSRHTESATFCMLGVQAQHASKITVFLRIHQASNAIARDTIEKAVLCIEDAQRLAAIESGIGSYEVLSTQIMRAILHYENNELEIAQALLMPALEQIRSINGWVRLYAEAYSTGSAIAGAFGGLDAAQAILRAGEAFAHERGLPRLSRLLAVSQLREYIRAGEWREAKALIETAPLDMLLASGSLSAIDLGQQVPALLEAAHLMVELGRPKDALDFLERINKPFLDEADNRFRFAYRVLAMRAAYGLRRYNAAVEHMQVAIAICRPAGLVRRALEARRHLIEMFDWSVRNGRQLPVGLAKYIEETLRNADGAECGDPLQQTSPRRGLEQASNNFMLSPRESEIIALMAEGYINKEIATRLGISEGTVKTHRKKIHEKLGVSSRSQAIMRARELLIV